MKKITFNDLSQIFSSLSVDKRIKLLKIIRDKHFSCKDPDNCELSDKCCDVSELSEVMNMPVSTISYHLKELRRAGLIETTKKEKHVYCSINRDTMETISDYFKTFNQKIYELKIKE